MSFDNQNKQKGCKRIYCALINSYRGLLWLSKNEAAFRQELVLLTLLTPLTFYLDVSAIERILLLTSLLLVLLAETINTAIESVVDRIGLEIHELSGLAKDLGSSAVFITLVIAAVTWGGVLWP